MVMGRNGHGPKRLWAEMTSDPAVYMLLGALPIEAEIHKKQLSILHAVISSDNKCLRSVVQRQLACSFNNEFSFFPYGR